MPTLAFLGISSTKQAMKSKLVETISCFCLQFSLPGQAQDLLCFLPMLSFSLRPSSLLLNLPTRSWRIVRFFFRSVFTIKCFLVAHSRQSQRLSLHDSPGLCQMIHVSGSIFLLLLLLYPSVIHILLHQDHTGKQLLSLPSSVCATWLSCFILHCCFPLLGGLSWLNSHCLGHGLISFSYAHVVQGSGLVASFFHQIPLGLFSILMWLSCLSGLNPLLGSLSWAPYLTSFGIL